MTITELVRKRIEKVKEAAERCKRVGYAEAVIMADDTWQIALTEVRRWTSGELYNLYCMDRTDEKLILVRVYYEKEKAVAAYTALTE